VHGPPCRSPSLRERGGGNGARLSSGLQWEASPNEGDVVGMVTDCHLAHSGAANHGNNDEAVLTSDNENGGLESHLTNPIRCQNLTT
jgi:hypothetical protein